MLSGRPAGNTDRNGVWLVHGSGAGLCAAGLLWRAVRLVLCPDMKKNDVGRPVRRPAGLKTTDFERVFLRFCELCYVEVLVPVRNVAISAGIGGDQF